MEIFATYGLTITTIFSTLIFSMIVYPVDVSQYLTHMWLLSPLLHCIVYPFTLQKRLKRASDSRLMSLLLHYIVYPFTLHKRASDSRLMSLLLHCIEFPFPLQKRASDSQLMSLLLQCIVYPFTLHI